MRHTVQAKVCVRVLQHPSPACRNCLHRLHRWFSCLLELHSTTTFFTLFVCSSLQTPGLDKPHPPSPDAHTVTVPSMLTADGGLGARVGWGVKCAARRPAARDGCNVRLGCAVHVSASGSPRSPIPFLCADMAFTGK